MNLTTIFIILVAVIWSAYYFKQYNTKKREGEVTISDTVFLGLAILMILMCIAFVIYRLLVVS